MTGTERVLQRKDASSLIVAIVLGFTTLQFIANITAPLSAKILGQDMGLQSAAFKDQYLAPLVALLLQVIAVEILVWLIVGIRSFAYAKTTKKGNKK